MLGLAADVHEPVGSTCDVDLTPTPAPETEDENSEAVLPKVDV